MLYEVITVFGTGREIGLGTVSDPAFDADGNPGDSARRYLGPDDPYYKYADMLYAWKIARHCNGEPYCLEVGARITSYNVCYTKLLRDCGGRLHVVSKCYEHVGRPGRPIGINV